MPVDGQQWKILIVDDDPEVHIVTRMVLEEIEFDGRRVNLLSAYREKDVVSALTADPDIALIILDVVIDTQTSGLDLVRHIREDIGNRLVRIILRTGQPGMAPESKVIIDYDINDYKEKTELTSQKLITSIITALRSYRDLLELERHKRSLIQTGHFLKSVIRSISSALIVVDAGKKITEWNPFAERFFSCSYDQAIGRPLFDIVPRLAQFDQALSRAIEDPGNAAPAEAFFRDRKDSVYSLTVYPLITQAPGGAILLLSDITEKQRMEEQLRRSQKLEALGSLAAGLAHDVNNALGGILGSISLIDYEKEAHKERHNSEYDTYLSTIRHSTERASGMVKQLLSLTKKEELKQEQVDLAKILANVQKVCTSSFDKRVKIRFLSSLEHAFILGDASQLEQVLLNLSINGYHAMTIMRPETETWGGELVLKLIHDSRGGVPVYRVSVKDSGVGIPEADIEKIFDPFYSTKPHGDGTGLGLAIVHKIVSFCRGTIDVQTEQGAGTEFTLEFPVYEASEAPAQKEDTVSIPTGSGTVLLCDDEILMLNIGKKILTKVGYNVITAVDGEDVIQKYTANRDRIDLVILDYQMPSMSGVDVFRKLQSFDPQVKALISSGYKDEGKIQEARDMGMCGFLQKPYTMQDLALMVRSVLKTGRSQE